MIERNLAAVLRRAATWAPSITLTGPRQSGKTTLCRAVFPDHSYCSLEAPDDRSFAHDDPRAFLKQFPRGAIVDEVQRVPHLLSYLQGIIDADPVPGRWILTGSQNFALLESVTQSLAGRTALHQLLPLSWDEIRRFPQPPADLEAALFSSAYPRIPDRRLDPPAWLRSYVATYIERDVRTVGAVGDLTAFQRFVELSAGRTAQLLNYSSLADDCGISQPTAKAWFSILEASFIAFHLPSFNLSRRKRLVKMPKLYFYDAGLACWFLGIREPDQLRTHPLRGALFETWVVSEVLKHRTHRGEIGGLSFYRDRNGVELDLVVEDPDLLTLIEAKSSATASSSLARGLKRVRPHLQDLRPRCDAAVVYGGDEVQRRTDVRLIPWRLVRSVASPAVGPVVQVFAEGSPVANADVLAVLGDGTWKSAKTDEWGRAALDLHSGHLPTTVLVAGDGFLAHEEPAWVPDERALHVQVATQSGAGSRVFEDVAPDHPWEVVVQGQATKVDLVEGAHQVLDVKAAQGPDRTDPGWAYPRRFVLRVAKVLDRAAVLEYRLDEDRPTSGRGSALSTAVDHVVSVEEPDV